MPKRFFIYPFLLFVIGLVTLLPTSYAPQTAQPLSLENYFTDKGTGAALSLGSFAALLNETADSMKQAVLGTHNQTPPTYPAIKGSYKIAVVGDSMVATLGDMKGLNNELKALFPNATFKIVNAGAASTTIDYGLYRLTNSYNYLGEEKPSILSLNPDIIVIESFAYNHGDDTLGDLNHQWLTIAEMIKKIKEVSPQTKIILATTIAPHCPTYTDGSANLPPERKWKECKTVKKYLQNMTDFARSQNYPLADSYQASLNAQGEGKKEFIANDNIHPSDKGGKLFAESVAQKIKEVLLPQP